jgi:hypothetical protein
VKVEWNALVVWKEEIGTIDEQVQGMASILLGGITHLESETIHAAIRLQGTIGITETILHLRILEKEGAIRVKGDEIREIWIYLERQKMEETLGEAQGILVWKV